MFSWIIGSVRERSTAANAPKSPTPALFTRTSTSGTSATILSTPAGSERSVAITRAPPSSAARASSLVAERAASTRSWSAASTRAISSPIPPDAPVTNAVLMPVCSLGVRGGRIRAEEPSSRYLARDGGAVHRPAVAGDVAHGHVLHGPVVPERDVADAPAPPARERVLGGVGEEEVEQEAVLGRPPLVQPHGVLTVHVQGLEPGLGVAPHHRMALHPVRVIAGVHGHAREHVVHLLHLR